MENSIKLFEDKKVRVAWNEDEEKWYFSVIDVVGALSGSSEPRRYWSDLKIKLKAEGSELYEKIVQLKMVADDGKMRLTDVADMEQILRLIQSIPSKKAEPFKLWLARVGRERIDEIYDPEITINRALDTYRKKGYSESWINQRLKSIEVRKDFTDELQRVGINKSKDFAILTNTLTEVWSGHTVKEYKNLKGLKKENLRDNMTNTELVFNMLAEISSTEISKCKDKQGFEEAKQSVITGGSIAKNAREELERVTGKKVITAEKTKRKIEELSE